jgi:biopolymer transport protein ExbB
LLAGLLDALDETHEEAAATLLRPVRIWTARGEEEPVSLLSVGHAAFAYRAEGGRIGLALNDARGAAVFRWSEDLDGTERALVEDAIRQMEAGAAARVVLPVDVSGRLGGLSDAGQRGLWPRLRAGGPVMIPLAVVALLALVLMTERAWWLFLRNRMDEARIGRALGALRAGEFGEAERLLARPAGGRGLVARVLAAGLDQRTAGVQAVEDGVQEQLLEELPRLDRFMGGLAMLAAVAPLLGLLGTVTGIIHTFGVIRALGNANPELMAGGISEALVTTAAGLVIAIPILLAHSLLRGRTERLIAAAEQHGAAMLNALARRGAPSVRER